MVATIIIILHVLYFFINTFELMVLNKNYTYAWCNLCEILNCWSNNNLKCHNQTPPQ